MGKRQLKIKHIFDPIFRQNYYYFNDKTHESYRKRVLKRFGVELPERSGTSGRFNAIETEGQDIGCIWARDGDMQHIVHECLHAVYFFMEARAINNEEVYCYALQFLVKEIIRNKVDKRIIIRR